MKKLNLTPKQILETLSLSEIFPLIIWYTEVCNSGGRVTISVQGVKNASPEEIQDCVKSVFPIARFIQFSTSNTAWDISVNGHRIGSLHMKHEEMPPVVIGGAEEIFQEHYTIGFDLSKVESLTGKWSMEDILRQEG